MEGGRRGGGGGQGVAVTWGEHRHSLAWGWGEAVKW